MPGITAEKNIKSVKKKNDIRGITEGLTVVCRLIVERDSLTGRPSVLGEMIIGRVAGWYDKTILELQIGPEFLPLYRKSYTVKVYDEFIDEELNAKLKIVPDE